MATSKKLSGALFAAISVWLCAAPAYAANTRINPAFLNYVSSRTASSFRAAAVSGGAAAPSLGYRPSPVSMAHMAGKDISSALYSRTGVSSVSAPRVSYAASYDLRTYGKVTPVKDQGVNGDCWAYATFGSLESNLLPSETWDFNEYHMATNAGYDSGWGLEGGNSFMSTAYMSRWTGPVTESDTATVYKHLQGMFWLPNSSGAGDSTFINNVKAALTGYGAVYSSIYSDNSAFNNNDTNFYNSKCTAPYGTTSGDECTCGGTSCGGHAITLIGWDDNYSKSNFTTAQHGTPAGNGAFIAKNSWGTSVGSGGYFYISYYDTSLGGESAVFNVAEATTNYTNVYQYDTLGYIYRIGNGDMTGTNRLYEWMSNIFTASAAGNIKAAGFYTTDVNASYEIYVYTGVTAGSPRSGTLAYSGSGSFAASGYHTVAFTAVPVSSGQRFSVVVKLTNSSDYYPIPVEMPTTDLESSNAYSYSSLATASSGQSYYSGDGSSWTDLTTVTSSYYGDNFRNANVCLKAYLSSDSTPPTTVAHVYDGAVAGSDISHTGSSTQLTANWTASSDPESGVAKYQYAIGTVSGSANFVDWSDNGTNLSVTRTGLTLAEGTTYYFGVRAVNGVGTAGTAAWSDGQYVDTSIPESVPYVYDSTGTDIDYVNSSSVLSANWGASSSGGVSEYDYAVGTTAGGTNLIGWTSAGLASGVTRTGLSLTEGVTYYFTVRAYNASSGKYSASVASDGQRVDVTSPTAKVIISSPLGNGAFSGQLVLTEASGALAWGPSLSFVTSGGLHVPVTLTYLTGSTWTITGFVESYYSTGTASFSFSAADAAGNTGFSITSGGSFAISMAITGSSGGTVSNSDGDTVTLPAGAYSGTLFVSISTVPASRTASGDSATSSSARLQASDLVREFSARDLSGTSVTTFASPVTITLAYPDANGDGRIDGDYVSETLAGLYYLDESAGKWTLVPGSSRDTLANTVSAPVSHFSVYSVRVTDGSTLSLSNLKPYPNPCRFSAQSLKIGGVPSDALSVKVYIFNSAGELVRTLSDGDGVSGSDVQWDGRLKGGGKAATGLYIYLLKTANYGSARGKFFAVW